MFIRKQSLKEVTEQLKNSGGLIGHQAGMSLFNANGAIDSSSLGYKYTIQTTTLIRPRVSEQKFYEIPFADFIPVKFGNGAWLDEIKTNVEYQSAGDFESGVQGTGQETRIVQVSTGLSPISYKIKTWLGGYQYSLMEMEKALAADNWNVIEGKHKSLEKLWQLGLQKIAFLGSLIDPAGVPGLATNTGVNTDVGSIISKNIGTMNYTEFAAFVGAVMADYRSNCGNTVYPDHFAIPEADWNSLAVPINPEYPVAGSMKIDYLQQAFAKVTGKAGFKIYPCAYLDKANNTAYNNSNRYVLYRKDEETMVMDVPLDLTQLAPNTDNNFTWNGVAYGQYTGVQIIRVPEVRYYDHS